MVLKSLARLLYIHVEREDRKWIDFYKAKDKMEPSVAVFSRLIVLLCFYLVTILTGSADSQVVGEDGSNSDGTAQDTTATRPIRQMHFKPIRGFEIIAGESISIKKVAVKSNLHCSVECASEPECAGTNLYSSSCHLLLQRPGNKETAVAGQVDGVRVNQLALKETGNYGKEIIF
jgi:hypothetical protein